VEAKKGEKEEQPRVEVEKLRGTGGEGQRVGREREGADEDVVRGWGEGRGEGRETGRGVGGIGEKGKCRGREGGERG